MVIRLVMRDGYWLRWHRDGKWYTVGEYDASGWVATLFLKRRSLQTYVRWWREQHDKLPLFPNA